MLHCLVENLTESCQPDREGKSMHKTGRAGIWQSRVQPQMTRHQPRAHSATTRTIFHHLFSSFRTHPKDVTGHLLPGWQRFTSSDHRGLLLRLSKFLSPMYYCSMPTLARQLTYSPDRLPANASPTGVENLPRRAPPNPPCPSREHMDYGDGPSSCL